MTENTNEPNNIESKKLESLAITEIKNIIRKYDSENFKITNISLYYEKNGSKNKITFNQIDDEIKNIENSRKRTLDDNYVKDECEEYSRRKKEHNLKDSILSVSDHRNIKFNMVILENNDFNNFSSILENCINDGTLYNYFRTGAFLNKILVDLKKELSDIAERSIVTGMLKGTGITSLFNARYGKYDESVQKKSRRFYYASLRVFEVYNCFPNPIIQIYHTIDKVSANALLSVGGKVQFNDFVNGIKTYVENNYVKYNEQNSHEKYNFDFNLITEDIKSKVKKFSGLRLD